MKTLIIGAGQTPYYVAKRLLARGDEVRLVIRNRVEAESFAQRLEAIVICGDGTDPMLYQSLDGWRPELVVALTPEDHDNLAACQLVQVILGTCRSIALVNDPDKREVFASLGVTTVICAAQLLGDVIEGASLHESIIGRLHTPNAKVEVLEVVLSSRSPACDKTLSSLKLPAEVIITAIFRDQEVIIPRGDVTLSQGDDLLLVCRKDQRAQAIAALVGEAP